VSRKLTTGRALSTINRSVCVSAETQAAPNLTEVVEVHWPAGPARPGSSPAASLTADWLHSRLVAELVLLTGSARSALAAGYLLYGGLSDIRVGRRRNISWPVVPGVARHCAYGSQSGNPVGHRHGVHDIGVAACQQ